MASFASSYIPTTTATVTRAADVASITGSNFGTTRTNLLVGSESFNRSPWSLGNVSAIPTTVTLAPNGTSSAVILTENTAATSFHFINYDITKAASAIQYTCSVYVKVAGRELVFSVANVNGGFVCRFNLATGTITQPAAAYGTGFTAQASVITPVDNGWYRCSITGTTDATTSVTLQLSFYNTTLATNVYTGDGVSGVYAWGAQLETGSAVTPYIPSTTTFTSRASGASYFDAAGVLQWKPQNLLVRSEEFDNTGTWSRTGLSTVTANAAVAPDGSTTADALVEDASTSAHRVFAVPASLLASTPYSLSVYVKASTRNIVRVEVRDSVGAFSAQDFDLTTQVVTTAGSGTGTISSVGNGWFRCTVNGTSSVSGGVGVVLIYSMQAVGNATYTGTNGTSAILIWGAQLEQRAGSFTAPGEYTPTVATATGGARNSAFLPDSSGVFRSAGPLLLEEARTNLFLNSEDFSNPTWALGAVTVTANAVASPTGATTADSLLETTANTEHLAYATSPITFTTATHSIYVKPNGRTNIALRFFHSTNDWVSTVFSLTGNGSVTQSSAGSSSGFSAVSSSIANVGNGWYRISMTATQASRSVYISAPDLCTSSTPTLATSNGSEVYAGDITKGVYVWGAQLEAASTASSYIPTTGSTVTRAADVSTSTATSVFESSWYNQTEGTVFHQGASAAAGSFFSIDDASVNNRITSFFDNATTPRLFVSASGSTSCNITSSTIGAGAIFAQANTYKTNDFAISTNGGTVSTDTTGNVPTTNRMVIGANVAALGYINGTIKRLVYWGQRLPNLQAITQ